jgi:hypothetical protein
MSRFFSKLTAVSPITRRYVDGLYAFSEWARREVLGGSDYRAPSIGWWIQEAAAAVVTIVMLAGILLLIPLAAVVAVARLLGGSSRTVE